jgi:hypothetical protein
MSRRLSTLLAALAIAVPLGFTMPAVAEAQSAAAKILEKARGQARDIEELRKVLNGPDQNMRLATFDAMIKSGDETLKQIAYETGLMSADSVMRAMAFKAVVMSLDSVHITLALDPSAPKPILEASTAHLARNGNGLVLTLRTKDVEAGTYKDGGYRGQVSGLEFTFDHGSSGTGTLTLADDNTMDGVVRVGRNTQFKATARLR